MHIFRVLEGAPCTVVRADEARNSTGPADLHRKLRPQSARQDMSFQDHEMVADFVGVYNSLRDKNRGRLGPIEQYILWVLNREQKRLYAFERGGWIAFYESKYVFE